MKQIYDLYALLMTYMMISQALANSFSCQILNDDEATECKQVNEPVCVVIKKGAANISCQELQCRFTYMNQCEACKNRDIIDLVIDGPCENYPNQAVFCSLLRGQQVCSKVRTTRNRTQKRVCGFYNLNTSCDLNPCFEEYTSGCVACNNELVEFYMDGPCPVSSQFHK